MLHTTFRLAREHGTCQEKYRAVARALGGVKIYGEDTPIPLSIVLEHTDLDSAIWALRCVLPEEEAERDKMARLFAADCAERVLPNFESLYPEDNRPRLAIEAARRFVAGEISREELSAADSAAFSAAYSSAAARAAFSAAYSSAAYSSAAFSAAYSSAAYSSAADRAAFSAADRAADSAAYSSAADSSAAYRAEREAQVVLFLKHLGVETAVCQTTGA